MLTAIIRYPLVVERASEELPAKATSLALQLSLLLIPPGICWFPSISATLGVPTRMCGRRSSLQCCELLFPCRPARLLQPRVEDKMV